MKLSLIVAFDDNRCMGTEKGLPWRIRGEMDHFRETTTGHPVIMGRKTWDCLPPKFRPLPGRANIVMTRSPAEFAAANLLVNVLAVNGFDEAVALAESLAAEEAFVIGGREVYALALASGRLDRLVVSRVKGSHGGSVYFPDFDEAVWDKRVLSAQEKFTVIEYTK
jgi:dihydrofolate reductase